MVLQFKKLIFISVFSLSSVVFAEAPASSQAVVMNPIVNDYLALKVGTKVFFASELIKLLGDMKKAKCLKNTLVVKTFNLDRELTNLPSQNFPKLSQRTLSKLRSYLQIKSHIDMLNVKAPEVKNCKGKFKSNTNIQNILRIESYLQSRFLVNNEVNEQAMRIFIDTALQKVFYEQF